MHSPQASSSSSARRRDAPYSNFKGAAVRGTANSRRHNDRQSHYCKNQSSYAKSPSYAKSARPAQAQAQRESPQDKKCFQCGKAGHTMMDCPTLSMLTVLERKAILKTKFGEKKKQDRSKHGHDLHYLKAVPLILALTSR